MKNKKYILGIIIGLLIAMLTIFTIIIYAENTGSGGTTTSGGPYIPTGFTEVAEATATTGYTYKIV